MDQKRRFENCGGFARSNINGRAKKTAGCDEQLYRELVTHFADRVISLLRCVYEHIIYSNPVENMGWTLYPMGCGERAFPGVSSSIS
jgi:hypothetical protein